MDPPYIILAIMCLFTILYWIHVKNYHLATVYSVIFLANLWLASREPHMKRCILSF